MKILDSEKLNEIFLLRFSIRDVSNYFNLSYFETCLLSIFLKCKKLDYIIEMDLKIIIYCV